MRICDVCYLSDDDLRYVTQATASVTTLNSIQTDTKKKSFRLWTTNDEIPEFCPACLELLRSKSFAALGKRQEDAMARFLTKERES